MPTDRNVDIVTSERPHGTLILPTIERIPRAWILSFVLLAALYIGTCGVPRLFDQIDGQYAGAAREMIERGDWLTPTQDSVPRLQKPPLVYWFEIASLGVLGKNEFAARLPIALAALGWFAATGLVARRVIGTSSAGVAAAVTLAAFAGTFFFCHLVMPEAFIAGFVALAFWALLGALQERRSERVRLDRWLLTAWAFIALGTLSKGLHALLFPIVAMSMTAWVEPSVRPVWRRFVLRPHGWVLFLVILAPWYAVTEWRYPGFLKDHFFNEQLGPALSRRWPPDSNRVPLPVFWLEHLALFFPMTLLFPAALWEAFRARTSVPKQISKETLLLVCWFFANALGISFSNLQDYYLMVAWSPVAVGIAWAVSKKEIRFKWPALVLAAFGGLGLLAVLALTIWHTHQTGEFGTGGADPVDQDTIMIVLQNLPPSTWAEIIPLICMIFGVTLVAGVLVFVFDRQGKSHLGFSTLALSMVAIFLFCTRGLAFVQDDFSSAGVAETINRMAEPDSIVIQQGDPNEKTSLFFYLHRTIYWVDGHPDLEFATRSLRIGRNHFLARAAVAEKWSEPAQVFLIVETSAVEEWKILFGNKPPAIAKVFGSQTVLVNRSSRKKGER
jgi:4-amino-4-deoxy-L-arabinose transferase-like glycosyltransferase